MHPPDQFVRHLECLSIGSTESQPRPHNLGNPLLKQLPTELIRLIAGFLSVSAAASFTLTCRSVWHILGSQYLNQLRAKDQLDRLVFLDILQRDLPRHVLCLECELLHSRAQLRYPASPCTKADAALHADYYIHNEFNSVTFLLAMKLYRNGLDYSEQLSLLSGFRSLLFRKVYGTEHIQHQEYTARIVNGHFLLRNQSWLVLPVGKKVEVPKRVYTGICPHWYFSEQYSKEFIRKLTCRASHWDNLQLNTSCSTCAGLFQCETCPTEFQIDAMDLFELGVALILTSWLDLGEGKDPLDSRYRSHLCYYHGDPVPFKAGSIKAAYEGGDVSTAELLTPKHKAAVFRLISLR